MFLLYNKPHQLAMFLGRIYLSKIIRIALGKEGGNLIGKFNIGCSL